MYRNVCVLIKKLASFGGVFGAKTMINTLREAYPRRPALLDEPQKTEGSLMKKHG